MATPAQPTAETQTVDMDGTDNARAYRIISDTLNVVDHAQTIIHGLHRELLGDDETDEDTASECSSTDDSDDSDNMSMSSADSDDDDTSSADSESADNEVIDLHDRLGNFEDNILLHAILAKVQHQRSYVQSFLAGLQAGADDCHAADANSICQAVLTNVHHLMRCARSAVFQVQTREVMELAAMHRALGAQSDPSSAPAKLYHLAGALSRIYKGVYAEVIQDAFRTMREHGTAINGPAYLYGVCDGILANILA